jgi:hypothetical protein
MNIEHELFAFIILPHFSTQPMWSLKISAIGRAMFDVIVQGQRGDSSSFDLQVGRRNVNTESVIFNLQLKLTSRL